MMIMDMIVSRLVNELTATAGLVELLLTMDGSFFYYFFLINTMRFSKKESRSLLVLKWNVSVLLKSPMFKSGTKTFSVLFS